MAARAILALLAAALPLCAHVVSTSSGDFKLNGAIGEYEFRVPAYEIPHIPTDKNRLLDAIQFSSNGAVAIRTSNECSETADGFWTCRAKYLFDREPTALTVACDYPKATVPHHMHIFTATRAGVTEQAFFDATFRETTLAFVKRSEWEFTARRFVAGFLRGLTLLPVLLFLAAFAVASANRKEAATGGLIMLAVIAAAALLAPKYAMGIPPRFVPAATGLSAAYLAADALLSPQGRFRVLIAAVLSIFHGVYLGLYSDFAGPRTAFLAGAIAALALLLGVVAAARHFVPRAEMGRKPVLIVLAVAGLVSSYWRLLK